MPASETAPPLPSYFDPSSITTLGERLCELLAKDVSRQHGPHGPGQGGLAWIDPSEASKRAESLLRQCEAEAERAPDLASALERVTRVAEHLLPTLNPLHSPHYMGHQVPPPLPWAGILQTVGATHNPGGGVYEMGPFPIAAERALVARLGEYLGWPRGQFDGIITSGGSLANLTALLAARNARYPGAWGAGMAGSTARGAPSVLTSSEAHYSVSRAAAIAGIGEEHVIAVGIDSRRRMKPEALRVALAQARDRGQDPFLVVGSACSTSVGAFDPLEEIGEIARANGLWFHVDGAHGASLLLSERHRSRLRGIELADSVSWDAHKMLFVPSLCTLLFFREARQSYQAFHQDAPYLFEGDELRAYDGAVRCFECTRPPLPLGLFAAWAGGGPHLLARLIDRTMELASALHAMLEAAPDFEALHVPECNIVCFRYRPNQLAGASPERLSELQRRIRELILKRGEFYITGTRIDGEYALRVSLMNPLTGESDLKGLLEAVRAAGAS